MGWHFESARNDILIELLLVWIVIRRQAHHELVQKGTDAIPIDGLTVRSILKKLRRKVSMGADEGARVVEIFDYFF